MPHQSDAPAVRKVTCAAEANSGNIDKVLHLHNSLMAQALSRYDLGSKAVEAAPTIDDGTPSVHTGRESQEELDKMIEMMQRSVDADLPKFVHVNVHQVSVYINSCLSILRVFILALVSSLTRCPTVVADAGACAVFSWRPLCIEIERSCTRLSMDGHLL